MKQGVIQSKMLKMSGRLTLIALFLVLVACGGQYRNHGYMPMKIDVDALVVGVDTREKIVELLGAPSIGGVVTDKAIYYVRSRVHHPGYMRPNEIGREVLVLSFGENQILRNVERFGIDQGKLVRLEHRVTKAIGGDRTILQEIIGSIGGFNPSTILNEE